MTSIHSVVSRDDPSSRGPPSGGSGSASGAKRTTHADTYCSFWVGSRCFALNTAIVGEIVPVVSLTPVPKVPPAVLGLFNLRGTPTALIDLSAILKLESTSGGDQSKTAVVLRQDDVIAAVRIDKMGRVIVPGQGQFVPRQSTDDDPMIVGFIEFSDSSHPTVTLLETELILASLSQLKMRR